jgi:hypothetical protein
MIESINKNIKPLIKCLNENGFSFGEGTLKEVSNELFFVLTCARTTLCITCDIDHENNDIEGCSVGGTWDGGRQKEKDLIFKICMAWTYRKEKVVCFSKKTNEKVESYKEKYKF